MSEQQRKELAALIDTYAQSEGLSKTAIPGVSLYRATRTDKIIPGLYNPALCFLAQGRKQTMLNQEIYQYGPSEYLIVSVDLPIMGQVTQASPDEPYLVIKVDISLPLLTDLLSHTEYPLRSNRKAERGIFVGRADATLGDSVLRLARMLATPEDIPVLATPTIREIFYRILRGEHGDKLAQVAFKGSHTERIASAIHKIKANFRESIPVEKLADLAGMSVSGFHAHFKSITAMSPLQFQKNLRLIEARNLMLAGDLDAATTAYQVGYESPSQFNREYTRMFGNPPRRDIDLVKQQNLAAMQPCI